MISYDFFQNVERAMTYVVYGDTDSLYINIPDVIPENSEIAIQHADEIGEEINNQIIYYTEKILLPKMGIDPQYNETLFKTELVCDGMMLLPVKKNYAYSLLAIEGKAVEGKSIEYTGIVKKSDIPVLTKLFIRTIVEEVVFNKELRGKNLLQEINKVAVSYHAKLMELVDNLQILDFGTPKKWSGMIKTKPWQVIAMELYNTILDEHVFSPMSAGICIPITINNPIDFETKVAAVRNKHKRYIGDLPISKLSKLAVPYNFDPVRVKTAMDFYGLGIDKDLCWKLVLNTVAKHIIETVKLKHAR